LKVENVLQDQKGNWVICDFGSATTRAQVYETQAEIAAEDSVIMKKTTPTYRAPEVRRLGRCGRRGSMAHALQA
jgi:serine/threonine protein kinase